MYICKIASLEEISRKWDYEIEKHKGDNAWVVWKKDFVNGVKNKKRICYYGILDDCIISEGTAILSKDQVQNSDGLVGETTAYLCAFRTVEEHQGKGYFSKLYKFMENDLKNRGYKMLTLGVEPCEEKNKKIYSSYGFTTFVKSAYEEYPQNKKIQVDYYCKIL